MYRSHVHWCLFYLCIYFSAGVGRTGSYIAIASVLDMAEKKNEVNVFDFVSKMRHNRIQMVQTHVSYSSAQKYCTSSIGKVEEFKFRHGRQIRLQHSAANPTNRLQPKAIITIVIISCLLWPAAGCAAKVGAKLSFRPLKKKWCFEPLEVGLLMAKVTTTLISIF